MLSRTIKLILVVALVAGSLTVATPTASTAPAYVVKAKSGDRWGPKITHARMRGGKAVIKWRNPTTRAGGHNIKSINEGARWTLKRKHLQNKNGNTVTKTLKKRGRFWFICTIHAAKVGGRWRGMFGQIHVF